MKIRRSALLRGALAGAVAVGLGVSGCSKNHEPEAGKTPTPTASNSATPSKTPTPTRTPTLTPTAPTGSVEEQLHAATVNFYKVINEGYLALDAKRISDLAAPGSDAVDGYVDSVKEVKGDGSHFEDLGDYHVSNFELVDDDANRLTRRVRFTLSFSGGKVVDSRGKTTQTFQSGTWRNSWILFERKGKDWLVVHQVIGESGS